MDSHVVGILEISRNLRGATQRVLQMLIIRCIIETRASVITDRTKSSWVSGLRDCSEGENTPRRQK